mgnify:CR=1 FL=1
MKERYAKDPEFRKARLQYDKERYANDHEFRKAVLKRRKDRYANDPQYRELVNQRAQERYWRMKYELAVEKQKPDFAEVSNSRDKQDGPAVEP